MSDNRYAVPIADLEGGARVALPEQVEVHAAPRPHEPLLTPLLAPFGPEHGVDGDGD